jgi:hypothetical protein
MFTRKLRKVRKRKTRRGGLWPFKKKEQYKLPTEYKLTNEDFKDIAEEEIKGLTHFSTISPNSINTNRFMSKFISYNPNDKKLYNEKVYRKTMRNALLHKSPDNYTKQLEDGRNIIDSYLQERELEMDIINNREAKITQQRESLNREALNREANNREANNTKRN